MPVPSSIDDLKPAPADNYPAGSEPVFPNLDDYLRAHAAFIAQLHKVQGEDAKELRDEIEKRVPQTSLTGAAILPEGPPSERPVVIPPGGLLMRGNTETGTPEYYHRTIASWINTGVPEFSAVPTNFCGSQIIVTRPHFRSMVWNATQKRYVRAPWHQPGKLQYFMRHVPDGHVEVRGDVVLRWSDLPDLGDYLGVTDATFVLDEARGDFLRNLDSGLGVDPGRTPGSWQSDAIRNIVGELKNDIGRRIGGAASGAFAFEDPSSISWFSWPDGGTFSQAVTRKFDASQAPGVITAKENRGRNRAYRLAVQY